RSFAVSGWRSLVTSDLASTALLRDRATARPSNSGAQQPQRRLRGPIAAHPVYSSAGWGGARGEVDALVGGCVGIDSEKRAHDDLREHVRAAGDVAADDVCVVGLVCDG